MIKYCLLSIIFLPLRQGVFYSLPIQQKISHISIPNYHISCLVPAAFVGVAVIKDFYKDNDKFENEIKLVHI